MVDPLGTLKAFDFQTNVLAYPFGYHYLPVASCLRNSTLQLPNLCVLTNMLRVYLPGTTAFLGSFATMSLVVSLSPADHLLLLERRLVRMWSLRVALFLRYDSVPSVYLFQNACFFGYLFD
jgi:hypothetical protein